MKIWRNASIYAVALFVVQGGTMYLLLRVWQWRFFPSAIIAALLTALVAYYLRRRLGFGSAT